MTQIPPSSDAPLQSEHFEPRHFLWHRQERVGLVTLNRPERKNPLTFESYAELRDLFGALAEERGIRAIVLTGAGDNFC